jgi:hypothetical protein
MNSTGPAKDRWYLLSGAALLIGVYALAMWLSTVHSPARDHDQKVFTELGMQVQDRAQALSRSVARNDLLVSKVAEEIHSGKLWSKDQTLAAFARSADCDLQQDATYPETAIFRSRKLDRQMYIQLRQWP